MQFIALIATLILSSPAELVPHQGIKNLVIGDAVVDALVGAPIGRLAGPLAIEIGEGGPDERVSSFSADHHTFDFDEADALSELVVRLDRLERGLKVPGGVLPPDADLEAAAELLGCVKSDPGYECEEVGVYLYQDSNCSDCNDPIYLEFTLPSRAPSK